MNKKILCKIFIFTSNFYFYFKNFRKINILNNRNSNGNKHLTVESFPHTNRLNRTAGLLTPLVCVFLFAMREEDTLKKIEDDD